MILSLSSRKRAKNSNLETRCSRFQRPDSSTSVKYKRKRSTFRRPSSTIQQCRARWWSSPVSSTLSTRKWVSSRLRCSRASTNWPPRGNASCQMISQRKRSSRSRTMMKRVSWPLPSNCIQPRFSKMRDRQNSRSCKLLTQLDLDSPRILWTPISAWSTTNGWRAD